MIFARFFWISDLLEMEREHNFAIVILTKIQWTAYRVYINKYSFVETPTLPFRGGKGFINNFLIRETPTSLSLFHKTLAAGSQL